MSRPEEREQGTERTASSPDTWRGFTRSLGVYLPRRMGQLRRLGKEMRKLPKGKGKR